MSSGLYKYDRIVTLEANHGPHLPFCKDSSTQNDSEPPVSLTALTTGTSTNRRVSHTARESQNSLVLKMHLGQWLPQVEEMGCMSEYALQKHYPVDLTPADEDK